MLRYLFQDWTANKGHVRIKLLLVCFRLVHLFARRKGTIWFWVGAPLLVLYRFMTEYILCVELGAGTKVGPGLKIEHGYSLVVNTRTLIGRNVHLRHCITIGCVKMPDGSQGPSPVIGDGVEIGAGAIIIGGITVGEGAKIGAGSVVTKDVPAYTVVVGNPARILKMIHPPETADEHTIHESMELVHE